MSYHLPFTKKNSRFVIRGPRAGFSVAHEVNGNEPWRQQPQVQAPTQRAAREKAHMLEVITDHIPQWVVVMDRDSWQVVFTNATVREMMEKDQGVRESICEWLAAQKPKGELPGQNLYAKLYISREANHYWFTASPYATVWENRPAVAFVFASLHPQNTPVMHVETAAYLDSRTRMYNRTWGMKKLNEWLRIGRRFSICFADLDNLKYVNDEYGFDEGDEYILSAADVLSQVQEGAVVARIGGDEFMLLLPEATREAAENLMEALRAQLRETGAVEHLEYLRGMSYGVVEVLPGRTLGAGQLLALADERMHAYKKSHRENRGKRLPFAGAYAKETVALN